MQLVDLYRLMVRARELELATADLWQRGLISGELHAGTGEEAVAAGVVSHLNDDDALSLTHRCSPFLVSRGVPLPPMIKEMLGHADGLCGGRGGHMHLFSKEHRVATSGIVGASLPLGAGFALAAKTLRRGTIAIAQTGDGALNQGMALETFNLAVAWHLPLLVLCIDNGWAITTAAGSVTAGDLTDRARAFDWTVARVDGADVLAVHETAGPLIDRVRRGKGPAFLYATAPRMDGHYLGDPLVRVAREPLGEGREAMDRVVKGALASDGGGLASRVASLGKTVGTMLKVRKAPKFGGKGDPLVVAQKHLAQMGQAHQPIDTEVRKEVRQIVESVLEERRD